MERLGIEPLSVFGLPPVAFVNLAADLGLRYIAINFRLGGLTSLANRSMADGEPGSAPASLRDDPALRRDTVAAMLDRGVSISLGDGFVVREGVDIRDRAGDIALMAELGIPRINTVSFDPDLNRSIDQFGILAEMAAAAGLDLTLEFVPELTVADLPTALDAIRAVAQPHFQLLVDTMHLIRSGSGAKDIAAIDPDLIGYIHLSDAPLVPTIPDYLEEAISERMVPGTGELPLLDVLAALPRHLVIGLEVPLRSEAEAGVSPHARLGPCVAAARDLLAQLDTSDADLAV